MAKRRWTKSKAEEKRLFIIKSGIQNNRKRVEPGSTPVPESDLEKHFSADTIAHWLKKGVLEIAANVEEAEDGA